ncbi:Xylitol dehydrogenase [Galdieria sulphuraria]|uniref:Xylitol dehydrogenase n=1 Tax=Galdieria sulphuraria TaxID=130081 RepID=M2W3A1_GALSU|nr:Xylitol dehydrogenase [Galdieria sulphuraria]EME30176.1 Xylitol dehydrogenase [Galdieria sulphuraria]|eukprot:XP_005706696.1 Xylitol dehydrogenase [Galdieria sulphuraria]
MEKAVANKRFKDRVIIITGAAGSFGSNCANRFASEGAKVVITDVVEETKLREQATTIEKEFNTKAVAIRCDVTNYSHVEHVVKAAHDAFGRIDYLFNNAGYQGLFVKAFDYPVDDFEKVLKINTQGIFHFLKAVSTYMVKQGHGAIVNTASQAGVDGAPNMVAYATSKAAVIGMTKTSSRDLAPYNIRVNAISPAFIDSGFMWFRQCELQAQTNSIYYDKDPKVVSQQMLNSVPMRRAGTVDEVIGTVAFLLSDDAGYITGMNIQITGGIL